MLLKRSILFAPLGLFSLSILSGAFLISSNSYATDDNVVDNININVPISCSMEGTGMTSHNANIVNGTYQANIGTTTIKAYCNDSSGFAIYAIGYTNDEYGKNVLTNTTLGSTADIVTGTATSGSTSNWAMKLTAPTSPTPTYPLTLDNSFGSYHAVPAEYTKVAHRDSATDIGTSAEGSTLTTTYAAFMSQTQPAGTYIGQVRYTLVHPANETPLQPVACEAGKICYNANANTVEGQMGKQAPTNSELTDGITLWAPNFKRNGYGFAGWNDAFDYSGDFYGPNETITAPSDIQTNGLSLYAVWIKSQGILQNWDGCSNLAQDSVTALTDNRDNNTYAVAKLADNKCWMIENLRLDNTPELSSSNTHNPSLPLTNIYSSSTTSNHLSNPIDPAQSAWCIVHSSACNNQSMLATNNTTLFTNNISLNYSVSSNVYSYGNYYNWYSATAGQGKYENGSGYVAPGDICPVEWRLPEGKILTGDYSILDIALGGTGEYQSTSEASNRWRSYPNNFIYSGDANNSSVGGRGSDGNYWASSAEDAYYVRNLFFSNSYIDPGTQGTTTKFGGRIVRCINGT